MSQPLALPNSIEETRATVMRPASDNQRLLLEDHRFTRDWMIATIGGIDVNNTVIVPNRLMEKLDRAAARGSVRKSKAVAITEELAPRVTPPGNIIICNSTQY